MKEKNGFTLVELLAVVMLLAVITTIGTYSVIGIKNKINEQMWDSKIELIENRAKIFGEDYKALLKNTCTVDGQEKTSCLTIPVQTLLDRNYLSSKDKNADGEEVIINNNLDKDNPNYYANSMQINIYIENDLVYAKLITEED